MMAEIKSVNSHLWVFFLTTFTWSWFFWILQVLDSYQVIFSPLPTNLADILGVFGPSLAAIILTRIYSGKKGVLELFRRILLWRVGVKWYLFVLAWPAILSLLTTGIHILTGGLTPDFANPPIYILYPLPPEAQSFGILPMILLVFLQQTFLGSSMGEEIGWRGYALPRLLRNQNPIFSSLILGVIWGMWHLPRFFIQGTPLVLNIWFFLEIMADTIIFTWIYYNTKGSLLMALLFHTSITCTSLFLTPSSAHPSIDFALKVVLIVLLLKGSVKSQH